MSSEKYTQEEYNDDLTILSQPIDEDYADESSNEFYTNDFSLRGTIGKGGVGNVLLGFDSRIGREVAIKELLSPEEQGRYDERTLTRFIREAKITGRLEHPGIVPVYELGQKSDGTHFYVMKYLRGKTFKKALKECEVDSPEEAFRNRLHYLDNLIDVCEAMAFAHSKGITHRDIKPANIVLGDYGETSILDWGLAKAKGDEEKESVIEETDDDDISGDLTIQGEILGTPAYMAPEQVDSSIGAISSQTDVYALGSILFQILTGKTAYSGGAKNIIMQLVNGEKNPEAGKNKNLPRELVAICSKAMSKKIEDRFVDAGEMVEQLKAYRDGRVVSIYAYSPKELLCRFLAKNKALVSVAVAIVLAIGISAVVSHQARVEAVAAHKEAVKAKERAENALYDITESSNKALVLANKVNSILEKDIKNLIRDIEKVAGSLGGIDINNVALMHPRLQELKDVYGGVESFMTIKSPGVIAAVYPEEYDGFIGQNISSQNHIKWIFKNKKNIFSRVFKAVEGFQAVTLQVPIFSGDEMIGSLAAVIKPHELVKSAVSKLQRKFGLHVWIMQDDGYILYDDRILKDNNLGEIGGNLFSSDTYKDFPELRKFARTALRHNEGVGHYAFYDKDNKNTVQKIGAWKTLTPSENVIWKVMVVKRYD
ncbi:MAG: protein kinase [Alphaproteobacteria bacterium]|nr:protein kinase [Alphaproteobacteria bacterium]